jgi:hypothetical protein
LYGFSGFTRSFLAGVVAGVDDFRLEAFDFGFSANKAGVESSSVISLSLQSKRFG